MIMRRDAFRAIVAQIPKSRLRAGLTRRAAGDTAWVIASPDTRDQLVRRAGYTDDELEEWVGATLIAALLKWGRSRCVNVLQGESCIRPETPNESVDVRYPDAVLV